MVSSNDKKLKSAMHRERDLSDNELMIQKAKRAKREN
jgi:hypothetical protein